MAKTLNNEEEMNRRIKEVGEYFCITGESYRKIAEYFSRNKFSISYVTVKDYIERYKKLKKNLSQEIDQIISDNTVKKYSDDEQVISRIYKEAELIENGLTLKEIASSLLVSESVVSRDINLRLSQIDPERYKTVKEILKSNTSTNLGKRIK